MRLAIQHDNALPRIWHVSLDDRIYAYPFQRILAFVGSGGDPCQLANGGLRAVRADQFLTVQLLSTLDIALIWLSVTF